MNFEDRIAAFSKLVSKAKNIVVFSGAGISTASGIPDFRSANGLYSQKVEIDGIEFDPEYMLSNTCLANHPKQFFEYLREHLYLDDSIKPNIAHQKIAEWEKLGKDVRVITMNIDGLHQAAGSTKVYPIHGTLDVAYCEECAKDHDPAVIFESAIPRCECGGIIRPDVVLYGEGLPNDPWTKANDAIARGDLLIVVGSSLTVYPAAMLPLAFVGHIVIINRDATQMDTIADIVFKEDIANVFEKVVL